MEEDSGPEKRKILISRRVVAMKIVHAVQGFEANSGISEFVAEICRCQVDAGHNVTFVYQYQLEHELDSRVLKVRFDGDDSLMSERPDFVHIHALWCMFSSRIMRWCRKNKIPYAVSPHGCLMPAALQKSRIKKRVFLELFLRESLNRAAFIHATAPAEEAACRAIGINNQVEIFPLGTKLPREEYSCLGKTEHVVLFLGRISPEKGLATLLEAWKTIPKNDWKLVIAGPDWGGHANELRVKVKQERIESVRFVGPVVGVAKEKLYREASLFVLPSIAENFSAVLLDALAYSIPAIATKGTPWRELEEFDCGWWIDQGVRPLATALCKAIELSDKERSRMGKNGRRLAASRYDWGNIANRLTDVYKIATLR